MTVCESVQTGTQYPLTRDRMWECTDTDAVPSNT